MKVSLKIFTFVFLFGMLFTVVQYVPVLEEEAPHAKVDFFKKAKDASEGDGDGGEDSTSDTDADSFTSEGIISGFDISWSLALTGTYRYKVNPDLYYSHTGGIQTPPPRS